MKERDSELPTIGEIIETEGLGGSRFVVASRHQGGMGIVFRLNQLNPLLPDLALKVLSAGADFRSAEREARIWVSIGPGPHVAEAYWAGVWRRRPAILARWYPGVASAIHPEHWESHDFCQFAKQLITGLKYANESGGIIHRDIKPSNVLLDSNDQPYITDFGIAQLAERGQSDLSDVRQVVFDSARTMQTSSTAGTPPYMAPEIFIGARESVATDIYSLGVTLFELLTGEHPYAGPETDWRFNPRMRRQALDRWMSLPGAQKARRAITAAIAIDPSARCHDYESLLEILGERASARPAEAPPGSSTADIGDAVAAVNLASVYRHQGQPERADAVLQSALEKAPGNPVILNAYGAACARRGDLPGALGAWRQASRQLQRSDGVYANAVYLDPVANLARHLVLNGKFDDAATWLRQAEGWAERHNARATWFYPETGWLHLFDRRPRDAEVPLRLHLAKSHADLAAATWLTLACSLVDDMADSEPHLCRTFAAAGGWGTATTIAASLVVLRGTSSGARQLEGRVLVALQECRRSERVSLPEALGATRASLDALRPCARDLIALLDRAVTGGRNHEMA